MMKIDKKAVYRIGLKNGLTEEEMNEIWEEVTKEGKNITLYGDKHNRLADLLTEKINSKRR